MVVCTCTNKCAVTGKGYIGKTDRDIKTNTKEHSNYVWKVRLGGEMLGQIGEKVEVIAQPMLSQNTW